MGRSSRRYCVIQDHTGGGREDEEELYDSQAELIALGDGFDVKEQGKRG